MMFDRSWDFRLAELEHAVIPGELCCSAEPVVLSTVLGSCVAVCLWDKGRQLGGMSHFALPHAPEGQRSVRYGDVAIGCLREELARLGARTEQLQAKIFGGADVLTSGQQPSIGAANVALALECLRRFGIPVTSRHTRGKRGRLVAFHTGTGEIMVRPVPMNRVMHGEECALNRPAAALPARHPSS